jgi:AcrR family transcriptional regulator
MKSASMRRVTAHPTRMPAKKKPPVGANASPERTLPAGPWKKGVPGRNELFELKRRAVLREAGRAFSKYGFHNITLDQLAEALNISKPTLYTYFPNKQLMLYECHRLAMDLGDQAVARMKASEGRGLERILVFLEGYLRSLTSELGHFAVLTDYFALLPEHRDEILKRRSAFDREFRSVIEQGIADGSIRPCDPKLAVNCFMGTVNWLPMWFSPDGPSTGDEVASEFVGIFRRGLKAVRGK